MKKSDLQGKKKEDENRINWDKLSDMKSEDKAKLIEEYGCILIFDYKKMEVYKIERLEL